MRLAFAPYILELKKPAGTSRGVITQKPTVLIKVWDESNPEKFGIGEAAVFPNLSPEANERLPYKFMELLANVAIGKKTDLRHYSSIQCGFEQALYDFSNACQEIYFPSTFTQGTSSLEINGLIWMGNRDYMLEQIELKLSQGFNCIKLKIGAIDWQQEYALLKFIRERYSADQITVRVDANGGFNMDNVFHRLKNLADLDVHSIEQPIPAGNAELMGFISKVSPVPIALDEELIGVCDSEAKRRLLEQINPSYIILRPSLCGGFGGAEEWISLAKDRGIGYWATSALESNIGLNAIAQWAATIGVDFPQGLGTGGLFKNNFPSKLKLDSDKLSFDTQKIIDRTVYDNLPWQF